MSRTDPLTADRFIVQIDGPDTPIGPGFTEILLPPFLLPVPIEPLPLVLRRGATGGLDLWRWWKQEKSAPGALHATVIVAVLDARREPVMRWRFANARPVRLSIAALDARNGETLIETIEIGYDTAEIVDPDPPTPKPRIITSERRR